MSDAEQAPVEHEHREQGAARILEEAGIVTHPDGSEREPTPEPHPFDDHPDDGEPEPEPEPAAAESGEPEPEPEPEPEGEGDEDLDPDDDITQGEMDLSALAESLEISVDDLYKVEIPLGGDDGNFTLGEVKDQMRELRSIASDREILVQDQTSSENMKLVARQELQQVVAMLGDSISPQLLEHARGQLRVEIAREREATFEAIPEWRDQETATRERTAINTFLNGYGFSDAELGQVYDHRLLKLARDSQRNQSTLRTAAEKAVPQRELPGKPGTKLNARSLRKRKRAQSIKAAATGGPDAKLAAVSGLISGE